MYHFIVDFVTVFTCSFYGSLRPEINFLHLYLYLYIYIYINLFSIIYSLTVIPLWLVILMVVTV